MVKANKSKNNVKNLKTVSINNLSHFYGKNENKKQVLNDVNLNIDKGELVLLKGPSGCGKTTLLTLIGALRTCQSGDLTVLNNQLNGASRKTRQILRRSIGMIFQGHNLLRCLTAEQNVQMGADLIKGLTYLQRREIARNWLSAVGLEEHHKKLPNDLSGGQKQRVAIARALSANPKLLLADEPTSALDSVTGREIVTLLRKLAKEQNCSVLMVTHDPRISDMADRILNMEDGNGECGGSAYIDECDVCDSDPGNDCVQDCLGEWGGDAVEDMCGTCDNDSSNDCVQDDCGEWGR